MWLEVASPIRSHTRTSAVGHGGDSLQDGTSSALHACIPQKSYIDALTPKVMSGGEEMIRSVSDILRNGIRALMRPMISVCLSAM